MRSVGIVLGAAILADATQPIDDMCGTAGSTHGLDSITCAVTTTRPNDALITNSLVSPGSSMAGSNTTDICTDQGDATSIGQAGRPACTRCSKVRHLESGWRTDSRFAVASRPEGVLRAAVAGKLST